MLACDFSKQVVCACRCLSCVRTFQKKNVTKMIECFDFTCLACEKGVSIALLFLEKKRSVLNCFSK